MINTGEKMVKIFEANNPNQLYKKQLDYILEFGEEINPRGLSTKEICNVVTILKEPDQRLLSCFGRGSNIFFLVAEIIWILLGRGDISFMDYYLQNLKKYSDEGFKDYNGAYGIRLIHWGQTRERKNFQYKGKKIVVNQLVEVITKLMKEKNTRQAVINLWNPYIDNNFKSVDYPCNIVSMLKIRNDKLQWTQILRSNDINFGLYPTNVFQWTNIMKVVADSLNIELGEIKFWSDSLHSYDDNNIPKKIDKYNRTKYENFDIYDYVKPNKEKMKYNIILDNKERIEQYDKELKKGFFANWLRTESKYLNGLLDILRIYSLCKNQKFKDALNVTEELKLEDYKILVYENIFRLFIRDSPEDLLYLWTKIEKYPKLVKLFIIQGEVK